LKKTAILVDASFFIIAFKQSNPKEEFTGEKLARELLSHCKRHIHNDKDELFRIYVYDSAPSSKRVHYPISKKALDFSKSKTFIERKSFHDTIKKLPFFALRLGSLDDNYGYWNFKSSDIIKKITNKTLQFDALKDEHFKFEVKQKGVDMKIGLDIATLSFKKFVDKIVLITADSDFVPAVKHARREGIFIQLDAMHHDIKPDLLEHIDRLKSTLKLKKPKKHTHSF
jgi:uncharacterized LabA/DUF88 family protein